MLLSLFLKEKNDPRTSLCILHFKEVTLSSTAVWFGVSSQLVNIHHFPHLDFSARCGEIM